MGEVYRAKDTRVGRDVALKVLPEEFSEGPEARARKERFEREARALAALNHPNVAVLYSFEEIPGPPPRHVLAMELLDGETLREPVLRGALPMKKALDIAQQIAEGLAAAHEKGITHRDLKPENVFLAKSGHAKLLDFGIARRDAVRGDALETESVTVDKLTTDGTLVGTIAYMSPEQASGQPTDHRTDQFSLGVVLYEMLTGRRPFEGTSPALLLASILRDVPEPVERSNPAVPPPIRWMLDRLLSKDPADRYDSTRDLAREIETYRSHLVEAGSGVAPLAPRARTGARRSVGIAVAAAAMAFLALASLFALRRPKASSPISSGGPGAPSPIRIVVLPFENLGGAEDGYFAAGITEEITSRLASVRNLAVISRTTATQYDRKGKTVEQVGKDLGVGYVLEGSVRWDRAGGGPGRVRITPQLIRVAGDTHLWSERYDRQLADVFAIQGEVADGVARALDLTLAPSEANAVRRASTRNLEAYDLYLKALALDTRRQERTVLAEQIRLAGAAVEKDPNFVEALSVLSGARCLNYWLHYDRRKQEVDRARAEAERAVALAPDSAFAHRALGSYLYNVRLDYEGALAEFSRARDLQPGHGAGWASIAAVHRRMGKIVEAEADYVASTTMDPRNSTLLYNLGETQALLRKYPEAISSLERSVELSPSNAVGHAHLVLTQAVSTGRADAALRVLQDARKVEGLDDPDGAIDYVAFRTEILARAWAKALALVEGPGHEILSLQLQFNYCPRPLFRAEALTRLGRTNDARKALEEARAVLETKVAGSGDDARFHSSLGIAFAGLGRAAEAVREGERGVELMPVGRDAYRGVFRLEDLALIHTMVGNEEAAIRILDDLLSRPSMISVPLLRADPRWDPLRRNAKFEPMLATHEARS